MTGSSALQRDDQAAQVLNCDVLCKVTGTMCSGHIQTLQLHRAEPRYSARSGSVANLGH